MKTITVKSHAELNALVAENVMGFLETKEPDNFTNHEQMLFWHDEPTGRCLIGEPWRTDSHPDSVWTHQWRKYLPSTDIVAAWPVVEKMKSADKHLIITADNRTGKWRVDRFVIGNEHHIYKFAPTAPLAICLCALASVGIEIKLEINGC